MKSLLKACILWLTFTLMVGYASAAGSSSLPRAMPYSAGVGVRPTPVAADSAGFIYATDGYTKSIWKFTSDGTYGTQWGSIGLGNGQFNGRLVIAVDGGGNVCVSDSGNHRIQKFDSSGNFLTKWGSRDTGNNSFRNPFGIAVDGKGDVYVVDSAHNRIEKLSPSSGPSLHQQTYTITFTESGLPRGTNWSVNLISFGDERTLYSTNNLITFNDLHGKYNYTISFTNSAIMGIQLLPFPSSGSIDLGTTNVPILFATTTHTWAGYVAVSDLSNPQPVVTTVKGSWIVQRVQWSLLLSYSSQWIGIGGILPGDEHNLIQVGTMSNGFIPTNYFAWYEFLHQNSYDFPVALNGSYPVQPGDVMQAEISLAPPSFTDIPLTWNITIKDLTKNWQFSAIEHYSSSMDSADWIEEKQSYYYSDIFPFSFLANFGVAEYGREYTSVPDTNYATIGTTTAQINNLHNFPIIMVNNNGNILAQPSRLSPDGSFNVTWYHGQ
jgi:hypothetical protein